MSCLRSCGPSCTGLITTFPEFNQRNALTSDERNYCAKYHTEKILKIIDLILVGTIEQKKIVFRSAQKFFQTDDFDKRKNSLSIT